MRTLTMAMLLLGLVLFLATHSVRIFAEPWRTATIARLGPQAWKGLYSLVSLAAFGLLVWGFGVARAEPVAVWVPPAWTRHAAALLTLIAFILVAASNLRGTRIKAAIGHPMVAGVKVWALAHLIANGLLVHMVLFGGFLAWAILDFAAARRRDRRAGVRYPAAPGWLPDLLALAGGTLLWWLFARFGHLWLIGVSPLGGMGGAI